MSTDTKLLAAQAANKRLREALNSIALLKGYDDHQKIACEALATPDDTAELDALIADAERYRMKRLIDFKASKAINEDRWNNGYDVAVDYCINNGVPRAIDSAMKEATP